MCDKLYTDYIKKCVIIMDNNLSTHENSYAPERDSRNAFSIMRNLLVTVADNVGDIRDAIRRNHRNIQMVGAMALVLGCPFFSNLQLRDSTPSVQPYHRVTAGDTFCGGSVVVTDVTPGGGITFNQDTTVAVGESINCPGGDRRLTVNSDANNGKGIGSVSEFDY